MRRNRVAAAGVLATILFALFVARRGRDPQPEEETAATDAAPAAPTLAVAPSRAAKPGSGGDASGTEGADGAAPATPNVAWMPAGSTEDDPALPKERVPLEAEIVDPHGVPVRGAAVQAVWGEWRTKAYV